MAPNPDNITIVIKTFERPHKIKILHHSIRRYYPDIKIVIVDDSKHPIPGTWDHHTQYLFTKYDIGLSAGRNLGVEHSKTVYTLILDDDFEFCDQTNLGNFLNILDNTDYKLVAGNIIDHTNNNSCERKYRGLLEKTNDALIFKYSNKIPTYQEHDRYDLVLNFFLARTDMLLENPWDNDLKIREHELFFWQLKCNDIPVTFTPHVTINHYPDLQTADTNEYQKKRHDRFQTFHALACKKLNVKDIIVDRSALKKSLLRRAYNKLMHLLKPSRGKRLSRHSPV